MSRQTIVKKPYCKVCHDSGKPESEYTSHWVKDLNGKTTCPFLLKTECRYCYKLGHTAKFCDVLAKNNKEKERGERRSQNITTKKPAVKEEKKPQNKFADLFNDSDAEEEVVTKGNTLIENPMPAKKTQELTGWAAIAAKPKEIKPVVQPLREGLLVLTKDTFKELKPITESAVGKPAPWATESKPILKKSWADWSDSEDEEDEVNCVQEYEDPTW
jgi:hypothetical protein